VRTQIEDALIFGISGSILQANVLYVVVCIAVYMLFSYLLLGVNYAIMRFTGADVSTGMLLLIYYFAIVLAIAPGLAAAIAVGVTVGESAGYMLGIVILAAWELVAGTLCFALSKGVLHDCDIAMIKTK
jgi:hypothetical protein